MSSGQGGPPTLTEFLRAWLRFREAAGAPGTIVVVEGLRDRISLQGLGVHTEIALVHRGRTLAGLSHELARQPRCAILLTDWDTEGGHLARRLKEFLMAEGLRVDLEQRRRLARAVRGEVVHVEGLRAWAEHLAEREGASLAELLGAAEPEPAPTG